MEYDDSQIGLEVDGKRWAGENYGFQSEESYNKLFVAGKLNPVQQGIDRFGNYLTTSAQADPIVGPVLNFLGGSVSTIANVLPEPIKQGVGFVLDKNQEAAENIAAATGLPVSLTDPMTIADAVMGGAVTATRPAVKTAVRETLEGAATIGRNLPPPGPQLVPVGAGAAPRVQLNVSGGKANLTPQVMDLTIKDPEFLAPGVREGIAKDPDIAKQIVDRSTKVEKQANRLTTWIDRELSALTPKELKVAKKNQKKARADFYSQMSNMPQIIKDDPIAYRKQQFKSLINKEQHHLISKAQTSGFYDQMDYMIERDMADLDDLVAMGEYAKMRQASSGDVASNMLNMHELPHNEFHTYLRDTGQELKPEQIKKMVRKAQNADELMEMYKDFIDNQVSVKEDAQAYQKLFEMDNPQLYK
jgi:hypothetical protein